MIANYGYEDGSGFYYITIDTGRCIDCATHGCRSACPQSVLVVEMDDYDELVASVTEPARRRLRELCAGCKSEARSGGETGADSRPLQAPDNRSLPCCDACAAGAISHSW
jgi:hypothetical protein